MNALILYISFKIIPLFFLNSIFKIFLIQFNRFPNPTFGQTSKKNKTHLTQTL